MGLLEDIIAAKAIDPATRADVFANLVSRYAAVFPMTWTDGDLSITVPSPPVRIDDGFRLYGVTASRGGMPIAVDPDIGFHNPPLLIRDPAGSIIRKAGLPDEDRLAFRPGDVFRRMVADAVGAMG